MGLDGLCGHVVDW